MTELDGPKVPVDSRVKTTVSLIPAYSAECLCGWVAPDRWRRYDEACSDLTRHFRYDHPQLIKSFNVKRTTTEEIVEEAP